MTYLSPTNLIDGDVSNFATKTYTIKFKEDGFATDSLCVRYD